MLERADIPLMPPSTPAGECVTDATGSFAFLRVPAGRYRIRADTSPHAGPNSEIRARDRCDLQCVKYFSPTPSVQLALPHAEAGNLDEAFRHLDAAIARRDPALVHFAVAPQWDWLRADSRFEERLTALGLADAADRARRFVQGR